jgi:hypothetical protein
MADITPEELLKAMETLSKGRTDVIDSLTMVAADSDRYKYEPISKDYFSGSFGDEEEFRRRIEGDWSIDGSSPAAKLTYPGTPSAEVRKSELDDVLKVMKKKLDEHWDGTPLEKRTEPSVSSDEEAQEKLRAKHTEAGFVAALLRKEILETPVDSKLSFELISPMSATIGRIDSEKSFFGGFTREGYVMWFRRKAGDYAITSMTNYRHKPMIGGERLRPFDAYVGKSGKCFVRFIETPEEGDIRTLEHHEYIEIEYETALKVLHRFDKYANEVFDGNDDKKGEGAIAAVLDDLKLAANQKYGSW